jgi:D-methionine transport system substrate-binding protein
MKVFNRVLALAAASVALAGAAPAAAHSTAAHQPVVLKVGAALVPHAEILAFIKPKLAAQGIDLQVVVLDDEVQLNPALADKAIDANYFQHVPYLDAVSKEKGWSFTVAGAVHVEPIGFYSSRITAKDQLKAGATIGIPNNPSNEYRALVLLQSQGLIKLKPGITTFSATPGDIAENPKHLEFVEADAAQLPRSLPDLDGAVINTNVILEAKLDPNGAVFREGRDSPYANVVVTRKGEEGRPEIKKLVAALRTKEVKDFIKSKYGVAVVPAF